MRTATSTQTLVSAARGVRRVNTDVMTIPTPNTHFPPNFLCQPATRELGYQVAIEEGCQHPACKEGRQYKSRT